MKKLKSLIVLSLIAATACSNESMMSQENIKNNAESTGIVGGTEVKIGTREIFSTVGLYDKKGGSLCTGTLISSNLVLTAAHCIGEDPQQMVVFFSAKFQGAKPEQLRPVLDAKKHQLYSPKKASNTADIALIKFDTLSGLPDGYGPSKLLPDFSELRPGRNFVAVGYGLNWSWLRKKGAGTLRTTVLKINDPHFSNTEVLVDQSLRKGVCSGDSGGPGYIDIDGQLYIWGVVSRGDSLPIPLTPNCFIFSIYTKVDVYANWIDQTSAELLNN